MRPGASRSAARESSSARDAMAPGDDARANRCFRGCCVGTSRVRLDCDVGARERRPGRDDDDDDDDGDDSVARGDVLYAGPLSVVFYGRYRDEAIAIKRPKLRTTREIDRYHAELGLMLEARHENVLGVVGARARRRIMSCSFRSWRTARWMRWCISKDGRRRGRRC